MRSENLLEPPVVLIHAQAIAMQMEIQIAFNEIKRNKISTTVSVTPAWL